MRKAHRRIWRDLTLTIIVPATIYVLAWLIVFPFSKRLAWIVDRKFSKLLKWRMDGYIYFTKGAFYLVD